MLTMQYIALAGLAINALGLLSLLIGFVYGYGVLNQIVRELKSEVSEVKAGLAPRLTDLTRLEECVRANSEAQRGLQDTIRGDFARRLSAAEIKIAEIVSLCIERGRQARACLDNHE